MKSSLLALLTAATLSFASMGVVYSQEATTAPSENTDCVPVDGAVTAPESLSDDNTEAQSDTTTAEAPDAEDNSSDDSASVPCPVPANKSLGPWHEGPAQAGLFTAPSTAPAGPWSRPPVRSRAE
jgi:hypothetical protein